MNHRKTLLIVAFIGVLLTAFGFQTSPEYKILFEKAKFTMETRGDLNGAINIFNDIIKKYPKEREYAAKSQLYIGLCYEKLGVKEAQKAYQKVVSSYPEQTETVKLANEKLSLLLRVAASAAEEDKELSIRRIKELSGMGILGTISPDGRYLLYAEDGSLDLTIYEISTENKRLLIKGDIESDAYDSRWSPDGKLVAYTWYHDNGQIDLRIIGLDGTEPRVLYSDARVSWLDLGGWSPDGKSILTTIYLGHKTSQMVQVSVYDGSVRVLKDFADHAPGPARFSPDGRYIAYTMQQSDESGGKDIFVLALDGEHEIPLVQDPANDVVLDWTPDGRGILFRSDRTGSVGAWWIQVVEGKPLGTPELIKPDMGDNFTSMGFTRNGSYYFGTQKEMKDVYIAELDLVTGRLLSPPSLATKLFAGSNYCPNWSADGKQLLYLSHRGPGTWGARTICVRSTESGKVNELFSKLNKLAWVRWSTDSKYLLAAAANPKGGYGTFQIDLQTGDYKYLMTPHIGWPAAWSRDGKAIFSYHDSIANKIPLVVRDLETGHENELFNLTFDSSNYYTSGIALSNNGQQLAFSVFKSGSKIIKIVPAAGGEARDLMQGDESLMPIAFGFGSVAWASDDQNILFIRPTTNGSSKKELWMIPIQGGEPRKMELMAENMLELSVHPDGRHIAFTAGQNKSEVWVMQNFLPKEKAETSNQLTLKKLDYPNLDTPFTRLSPDGNKLAYVVYSGNLPKRIDILDIGSGKEKVLVESGAGRLSDFVWSPQGDKIAYTSGGKELHVRNIDGSNSRLLLKDSSQVIYPTDWSRDGGKIVCLFEGDNQKVKIGTVTSEGEAKFLISGNSTEFHSEPKISPDGNFIAFSHGLIGGNTDISVLTSDGNEKIRVTTHPGRDENPVWSSDGRYLLFLSDRNRSVDLWCSLMKNGKPVGTPFIIKNDIGWRSRIYDFTASGKLFLLMLKGAEPANLFTIPVDQMSGNLNGSITPISVYPTDHYFPRNSADGKKIAYLSRKGQIGLPKLFVLNEKGAEQELPLQGHDVVNVAWHPGNQSLIFAGWDKDYNAGIFEVSLEKEEIKTIYSGEKVDLRAQKGGLGNILFLSDIGKLMFFRGMGKGNMDVITSDPDGQNMSVVLPGLKTDYWSLPSPKGEHICYRTGDSLMIISVLDRRSRYIGSYSPHLEATWSSNSESLMFREGSSLKIFSLNGNTSRTLYEAPAGKTIGGMEIYATSWSPDGNRFIFTEKDTSAISTSRQKLLLINPGDGSVKQLGEVPDGYQFSELRWSPDGSKVVATGRSISNIGAPLYEYWVMENFLPK